MLYKLTDQNMQTRNNFQWELGVWKEATGDGQGLCSNGYLHFYDDPLLAVFFNPIHAGIESPRLFKAEGEGERLDDRRAHHGRVD